MNRRAILLATLTFPALAACTSIDVEETVTVVGVVETIDPRSREVLLRGQAGAQSGVLLSMVVSPRVQNLERVRPGDRLTVRYYKAVTASLVRAGSGSNEPVATASAQRNPPTAARPGGEVTRVLSGRVTVTAVDTTAHTVSFIGPSRVPRTVYASRPEGRAFLRSLSVGDQVDIVYEDALAVSIEPMR